MQAAQAEGEQGDPEAAENEQRGDRIGVVQPADAELALTEAQADGQSEAELAGLGAEALQPGQAAGVLQQALQLLSFR